MRHSLPFALSLLALVDCKRSVAPPSAAVASEPAPARPIVSLVCRAGPAPAQPGRAPTLERAVAVDSAGAMEAVTRFVSGPPDAVTGRLDAATLDRIRSAANAAVAVAPIERQAPTPDGMDCEIVVGEGAQRTVIRTAVPSTSAPLSALLTELQPLLPVL